MKKKKFQYKYVKWAVLPSLALVAFGLTRIFFLNPGWTEKIYSRGIYPILARGLSGLSFYIPFSVDDLFYIFLILSGVLIIVSLILRKITFKNALKIVLNVLAVIYILFYLFWGFNYFRPDLNTRLKLSESKTDTTKFIAVFKTLIEQTNTSYCDFENFDKREIDSLVEISYQNLASVLRINYPSGKRRPKKITFSNFFAKAGISGYFGPFFNEIHVNSYNLPVEFPFVLAHEKAHQFGITGEAEANFYAWLVCSKSDSKQLQYSANLVVLRYFISQGYQLDNFNELVKKIDDRVKADLREIREHWQNLRNDKIDRAANKVNDTYLKTNKVEKGIEDYYGVVKFVMDFKLDTTFQKKWSLNSE